MMRKVYSVIAIAMIVIVTVGCNQTKEVMAKNLDVHFEFVTELDQQEYPHTTAYLIVDAEQKMTLKIGEYIAGFKDGLLDENTEWDTPPNALTNYLGWYGGQGVILSIIKEGSQLLVKQKLIEEQSENKDMPSDVTSVVMDKDVNVTVKEAVFKEMQTKDTPIVEIEPVTSTYKEKVAHMDELMKNMALEKGKEISIMGESTEGGVIQPYYQKNALTCFEVTHYGEMGRVSKAYYMLETGVVFIEVTNWLYKEPLITEHATRQEQFYILDNYKVYMTDRKIESLDESDESDIMNDYLKYKDMITTGNNKTV
ncbi:hypothetical protein HZI73_14145 [Vallitalea pronyensis]|uniref:Uncharacterized protein n=1 Tax=Vallitalea pronyensis TaxID=1348613 RepID=A0A8J8MKG1_9FIRM|nr:hypothetical protein [Vallitalea pronyensis]QUI23360.1 hypothetical protein HZI73_14145 [Vallitalea pronyensis]